MDFGLNSVSLALQASLGSEDAPLNQVWPHLVSHQRRRSELQTQYS